MVEDLRKFRPAPHLTNGHLMTLAPLAIWRRFPLTDRGGEKLIVEVDQENKVSVCVHRSYSPLSDRVIMLLHGLESSAEAAYVKGVCEKALAAGFSVVRVNLRNCGNTLHLSKGLYNAGLSGDVLALAGELRRRYGFKSVYACGFSLGGNIVLKAAGESGLSGNNLVDAYCAVSPPADLDNCVRAIESGANRIYEQNFLVGLKRKVRAKDRIMPGKYPVHKLSEIKTLRAFDDTFTAHDAGYGGAAAYYHGASALRVVERIKAPTLILTAKDDPLVPFETFESDAVAGNEAITLISPDCGGHVGFVAAHALHVDDLLRRFGRRVGHGPRDKFWAEWQIVDFFLSLAAT